MTTKFKKGEIVIYKKDNGVYKIVALEESHNIVSGLNFTTIYYTIKNDQKQIDRVPETELSLV